MRRHPLLGLAAVCAIVLVAHVVSFGGGIPDRWRDVLDVAHVLGFAGVTWFLGAQALRMAAGRSIAAPWVMLAVAGFVGVLALVSESAQTFVARDASFSDLLRDAAGIVAGGVLPLAQRMNPGRRITISVFACLVLTTGLWSPLRQISAMGIAHLRVPDLIGFESTLDPLLYRPVNSTLVRLAAGPAWPIPGHLIDVRAHSGNAGIAFSRLRRNWSGYRALSFLIAARDASGGQATVRIHDAAHNNQYADRFNRQFDIGPEPRRIAIPLDAVRAAPRSRAMDLSKIEEIIIFVSAAESSGFLVDDLRLE